MHWISLLLWLALTFAVAGISARWTAAEIPTWYRTLKRPAISPPNWVFGPVWSLLYALMAVAAWVVSSAPPSSARFMALALFILQLILNFAWSWIFFKLHALGAALAEVVVLWVAIGATTFEFAQVAPLAAWLMVPYLAWVTFAAILNGAFRRLN